MEINMGLSNEELYSGCAIEEVGGRLNLKSPPSEAANIIGRNATKMLESCEDFSEVTLTGPMAVWAYMVVFHVVLHRFNRVVYVDGRGNTVTIAAHG